MAAAIQQDIQRMLDHGVESMSHSRQGTPEPITGTSPESTVSRDIVKNKVSRYNPFDLANIRDEETGSTLESHRMDRPPPAADSRSTTYTSAPSHQTAAFDTGQHLPEQTSYSGPSLPDYGISDPMYNEQPGIRDWYWDLGLMDGQDFDLNSVFDPFCRLQNQWDVEGHLPGQGT